MERGWWRNSCIVYERKTKDFALSWTFQPKSWHLCLLLRCLPGFITIPLYLLWPGLYRVLHLPNILVYFSVFLFLCLQSRTCLYQEKEFPRIRINQWGHSNLGEGGVEVIPYSVNFLAKIPCTRVFQLQKLTIFLPDIQFYLILISHVPLIFWTPVCIVLLIFYPNFQYS